jgi:hypothetical protein
MNRPNPSPNDNQTPQSEILQRFFDSAELSVIALISFFVSLVSSLLPGLLRGIDVGWGLGLVFIVSAIAFFAQSDGWTLSPRQVARFFLLNIACVVLTTPQMVTAWKAAEAAAQPKVAAIAPSPTPSTSSTTSTSSSMTSTSVPPSSNRFTVTVKEK